MAVTEVRLAGLTFNSGPDSDGDEFVISDIDGWDDSGAQLVTVEKPISDGAILVRARRPARALTVTGWVIAAPGHLGRARRKLEVAMNSIVTADGNLDVDQDDDTWRLVVRRAQRLRSRTFGDIAITFEADVVALNPAKTTP